MTAAATAARRGACIRRGERRGRAKTFRIHERARTAKGGAPRHARMVLTLDEAERLAGADVYDAKGELIGTVRGAHVLDGALLGVHVALDPALAELPTVGRSSVEVAPDALHVAGERAVRLDMELMQAVDARRPRRPPEG